MASNFINKYTSILQSKAILSEENKTCLLWHQTSKNYGRIMVRLDTGVTKTVYVHRLSYFLNRCDVSGLCDRSLTDQCSHLCNNSLCINPDHISLESLIINNQRRICFNSGKCTHHGKFSDCLLHLKL